MSAGWRNRVSRSSVNPVFAAAVAALWAIRCVRGYPTSYLFVPDREIWVVQIGTWPGPYSFPAHGVPQTCRWA